MVKLDLSKKKTTATSKKTCLKCDLPKNQTDFFLSNSDLHSDGRYPVCKGCLKENLDTNDLKSVQDVLIQINRPFLMDLWLSSVDESKRTGRDAFGLFMKNVQFNHKNLTWKDSVFEIQHVKESINVDEILKNEITDDLIQKWGIGYEKDEYLAFERKYAMLKNNYQEKTAMHTEALLTYIRYRVKEEISTAKNDMKAAKEWGQLAQKAAQDAKINPSQLSKSDLSDGLDTFGQLVRTVEQAVDIIPILPKFKERPQDKVDFTLWCYINYVRDLKGLPLADYKDIYGFYEARKKEFEERFDDLESEV
jgi:hypothetical protein